MAAQGSLVAWRAVFAALGVLMVGTLVYTCATDGSPFRPELLTPLVLLLFLPRSASVWVGWFCRGLHSAYSGELWQRR